MRDKLYDLMNWREIEGILYADLDKPRTILGPNNTRNGMVIQVFAPDAVKVEVIFDESKNVYQMQEMDDYFFAALLPKKETGLYQIKSYYVDDKVNLIYDPYQFDGLISKNDLKKFNAGVNYKAYEILGAHVMSINGVKGVRFAVWAPYAKRVSVVGTFNFWDGRRHMMNRVDETGVFELFIPGLEEGEIYKYEIKQSTGENVLKADPYEFGGEKRPNNASIVRDIREYKWTDEKWLKNRKEANSDNMPMSIYEVHLGSWKKPEIEGVDEKESFYTYRELAPMLAEYVKEMGYTHIELMPIMEHPFDASWGYQVTGYYAPTARYGTPEDFMYFMDYMHKNNIGVILDWVPAHFPRDQFGLAKFDGTCLYEHLDPRKGSHPHWGTLIYNYARPEVKAFLISNALFWLEKYHADGIRMDAVASMLYLDYGKNPGEWVANIYGGNENLEAVEFLKELNTQIKKRKDGSIVIAEESTAWSKVTGDVKDDGLGFDFKWNMGWMNDFTNYIQCDPFFRKNSYHQLTFSLVYAYSENFILVFSHDEVVHGKGSMIMKMPGDEPARFSNLKAAYAFMMAHPGKKLMFMGQEFAHYREWSEERQLDWESLAADKHLEMQDCVKALNKLYKSEPALYELDNAPEGFEWIDSLSYEQSICSFVRKGKKAQDTFLIVCNFDTVAYDKYVVGVPKAGKYKEIFNSDSKEFGGNDMVNARVKTSKKEESDGRANSITISLAPLSVSVFKYSAVKSTVAKKLEKEYIAAEEGITKTAEKKTVAKKATAKKTTAVKSVKTDEKVTPVKESPSVAPVKTEEKATPVKEKATVTSVKTEKKATPIKETPVETSTKTEKEPVVTEEKPVLTAEKPAVEKEKKTSAKKSTAKKAAVAKKATTEKNTTTTKKSTPAKKNAETKK